jgi:hypothetical protein
MGFDSLPAPVAAADAAGSKAVTTADSAAAPSLASLYVPAKQEATAAAPASSWLPPTPPGKKYVFKKTDGLGTVEKGAYFDMSLWT